MSRSNTAKAAGRARPFSSSVTARSLPARRPAIVFQVHLIMASPPESYHRAAVAGRRCPVALRQRRRPALAPRAGDRDRDPGIVDVDEQRAAVGREANAGQFALVQAVPREAGDLTRRRHAEDVLLGDVPLAGLILADEQVAPRRERDVV